MVFEEVEVVEHGYDRKKLEEEFDNLPEASPIADIDPFKGDIIATVGAIALDYLDLGRDDVLLDIGTGRGRWAVAASPHCKKVIGIDISKRMIEDARSNAENSGVTNVEFYRGSFEDPSEEVDLKSKEINKVIAIYSLHHLTDAMKSETLTKFVSLIQRPGTIVIGDIMWFDNPNNHRDEWDEVYYDDNETDHPAPIHFIREVFEKAGADEIEMVQVHPLVGLICARFL
ncbi:MAG TPA: class I SAM-dependent methyltransferase [Mesotoga sp.]|jgi:ubiquinone/menaquinone biosynthesis C-methylase UbiE|nr:class I SAM-dependent methyltransferase [Mesotoga sp.]MDI9374140.1 class I SAM-dependent methyltransferase [Thermotogota bacterium]MDD5743688.1 class I SAM-dependent methyltransferase [Mesotoga sp.]HOI63336.1 class I SAM-dependent methyltransferase [Mesotoga sp.]HPB62463.1 class I SAM-dependent methyltransferase [Mesotoga sp.]